MTDAVIISFITSGAACLAATASAYFSYKAKHVGVQTHSLVNSRMDELLQLTRASSHAEGKLEEKTEEQNRKKLN